MTARPRQPGHRQRLRARTRLRPPTDFGIDALGQAGRGLPHQPAAAPAGTWYELPVNPAAGEVGEQGCLQLPLYAWVTPGNRPAGDQHPARRPWLSSRWPKMALPTAPGAMRLNPASGRTSSRPADLPAGGAGGPARDRPWSPPACPTPRSRLSSGPTGRHGLGGAVQAPGVSATGGAPVHPGHHGPAVTWARPRSAPRRPGTPAGYHAPDCGAHVRPRPPPGRSPRP